MPPNEFVGHPWPMGCQQFEMPPILRRRVAKTVDPLNGPLSVRASQQVPRRFLLALGCWLGPCAKPGSPTEIPVGMTQVGH